MTRRRTAVAACAAVLAVGTLTLTALSAWRSDETQARGVREGGPLAPPDSPRSGVGAPVDVGRPYSWGGVILRNDGDSPVTVERIELIDPPPGLAVVGSYAVPEKDVSGIGFLPGYDPGRGLRPNGLVVQPGSDRGFDVVVGLEVERPGIYFAEGVAVWYRDGATRYREEFDLTVRLCAPAGRYEECAPLP